MLKVAFNVNQISNIQDFFGDEILNANTGDFGGTFKRLPIILSKI